MLARKNYKEEFVFSGMNKRGQVTAFIVVAVLIVVVIIAVFLVRGVDIGFSSEVNPTSFLRDCIEPKIDEGLALISKQGGSISPKNYVSYMDEKIEFLCYTSDNYVPCVVQQPLLVSHIKNELRNFVEPTARQCLEDLKDLYERRGFEIISSGGEMDLEITPESINVEFLSPMSISKDRTQTFSKLAIAVDSEIYDLFMTSLSIIQFESTFGDSEPLLYMQYYPDLRIEKINRDDGVTIYKLSDVVSKDEFSFASRSLVFPAGYSVE